MRYRYPNAVLMIFCKAPVAGQVKTRLGSVLTAEQCVKTHVDLSIRTLELATRNGLCPVQLWCSPSIEHDFFAASTVNFNVQLQTQLGKNLGERMHHAFCTALAAYRHALIIGCDCPSLTQADLALALHTLTEETNIVLAPAEDGGYVLIGLNTPQATLFEKIAWGTPDVLAQTRRIIKHNNLHHAELKEQWDVDMPADLLRYYRHISVA